ncbi:YadA family autotransporter adhesin [Haemophilus haemolyticus]|uniref:YadA family autotransporter adhesin n=1 Tax=Haemophilus haemolyticus TaxID=726 RepID=UPI000E56F3E4|nr:ESPR-type extended signal peptide-containing protein [Haemophilus haemolyticus]
MNKIFRIVWSEVSQAWVAVSELTKSHKKRASATVATAILATALSATVQASESASNWGSNPDNPSEGYTPPRPTNIAGPDGNDLNGLGFGLVVVDKDGKQKEIKEGVKINGENTSDDDKISTVITVEPNNDSAPEPPKNVTSYLYLVEGDGVTIDQTGRSAKFSVDTVDLAVSEGKVTDPKEEDKKKLVNAGNLSTTLNDLGWKVSADGSGSTTSIVKSGEEVEFKGEGGVTVTATTDKNGKHVVTIKTEKPQGGSAAGGSTPVTAGDGISVSTDNKVSVKAKTDSGITVDASGVSVNAKTDGGLTVGADGVSVKAKDKGGLAVDTDGVSVKTDGTTISVDAATGNVKAVTGTITAGATPSVDTADENKLATAGNVASAINAAKTKVVAGSGMKVTSSGNEYTVSADLPFTKNADKSISLNEEGVIRNVANGRVAKDSKDAVNGSQLHAVEHRLSGNMDKLNHRIDKVGKRADAGTASAIATANLLQSYRPGLSAATAAVGQYRGQSAIAVGYSRLSDNGKYGVKFSLGANTQGNVGAGAGVAYFW